jgi:hypothetical protein
MFKQNPVAMLATLVALLTAADGTLEGLHILSPSVAAWAAGAIAVLTAVLGVVTHGKVTPLANPRDNAGRPLTPAG